MVKKTPSKKAVRVPRVKKEPIVKEPVVDPRAEYNCEPCGGEGLLTNGIICDSCEGTGKT